MQFYRNWKYKLQFIETFTQDGHDFSHFKDVNNCAKYRFCFLHIHAYIYIHPSRHPSNLFGGLCMFWLVSKQHVPQQQDTIQIVLYPSHLSLSANDIVIVHMFVSNVKFTWSSLCHPGFHFLLSVDAGSVYLSIISTGYKSFNSQWCHLRDLEVLQGFSPEFWRDYLKWPSVVSSHILYTYTVHF